MATAMLPTPPEAPVTTTSPPPGFKPCSSRAITDSIAVNPAVPIIIDSLSVILTGRRTSVSDLTRFLCVYPPQ